jgi:hypothetical protein
MGFTVATPLAELLIERVVDGLGSVDVVHETRSRVVKSVVLLEKRKWVPV